MKKKKDNAGRRAKVSLKSLKGRIGDNLRRYRKQNGWRQDDMASFGFGRYKDMERGNMNPELETLWSLARVFGVDVSDLIMKAGKVRSVQDLMSVQDLGRLVFECLQKMDVLIDSPQPDDPESQFHSLIEALKLAAVCAKCKRVSVAVLQKNECPYCSNASL